MLIAHGPRSWQAATPESPSANHSSAVWPEVAERWQGDRPSTGPCHDASSRSGRGSASLNLPIMRKILVTGMSGTGKSSALAELDRLGFRVVDTDVGGWSEWSDAEDGYVWREDRMTQLLAQD